MASLAEMMRDDERVSAIVRDSSLSHSAVAREINQIPQCSTSERSVRRARRALLERGNLHTPPHAGVQRAVAPEVGSGKADITSKDVTFHGVVFDSNCEDAQDWTPIFKIFRLDPTQFEIVDDTVKISTWQQSKRLENGHRDTVQLWAHSARFRRRTDADLPKDVTAVWRTNLVEYAWPKSIVPALKGTYAMLVADPQLGKKGTEEAVQNWKDGVLGHYRAIVDLQERGQGPAAVHVGWMGDETENVVNSYTNQPHTIELNRSQQMELDYDLRMWTLREVAKLGLPISASSVISNHGEWTRNDSKDPVTTRGDNASTFVARQVQKTFAEIEHFGGPKIDWTIGTGKPHVIVNMSGERVYMSHGYIEKGKGAATEIRTRNAVERQILGKTAELIDVRIFLMAHYHHFYAQEFEGRTLFGMPALEAEKSSEYMLDQYGVWSPKGMLGLLIGRNTHRGWSHLSVV